MFVVGANNSGKTALLSSLDIIAGRGPESGIPNQSSGKPARIDAVFDLTDDESDEMRPRVRGGWVPNAFAQLRYTFTARDYDSAAELVEICGCLGDDLVPLIAYEDRENFEGQVSWSNWMDSSPLHGGPSLLNRFSRLSSGQVDSLESYLPQAEDMRPLGRFLGEWRRGFYHFSSLRTGGDREAHLRSSQFLKPDGSNIHEVLVHLRNNEPAKFSEISSTLASIVPWVGDLATPMSGESVEVALIGEGDGRNFLNIKDLGSGVEQLLLTLTVGIQRLGSDLLILEEPETNLHPAAQRSLGVFLRKVSSDRTIIVATHSPVLLDWRFASDPVWLTRRESVGSIVERVASEPFRVLEELGVRLSDVLAAERLLIVEGPTDVAILREWLGDLLLDARFAIAEGGGGDNARHADLLQRWAAAADRSDRRRILYMRDRDELPEDEISKLQESGAVAVLPRREIENYFLDPSVLQQYFGELPEARIVPTIEELQEAVLSSAENVRRQMVIGRVSRSLRLIRPIGHDGRRQLVKQDANRKMVTDYAIKNVPRIPAIRREIADSWAEAESFVSGLDADTILRLGPGEEILGLVFGRFVGRKYSKRDDGPALARLAPVPAEVADLLQDFIS